MPMSRLLRRRDALELPDDRVASIVRPWMALYDRSIPRFPRSAVALETFRLLERLSPEDAERLGHLREWIHACDNVCVAYSGGVDSTLVAAIAKEQLDERAWAITGVSPALAPTC